MESEDPLALNDGDATAEKQMHGESPHISQLDTSLQSDVEIEQVEPEEFAFLDTATQQAALQIGKLTQRMRTKWLIYIRRGDTYYSLQPCNFCFWSAFAEVWSHCNHWSVAHTMLVSCSQICERLATRD